MLDFKKILQLGLGVAIGMIAYHFIQKAMNKSMLTDETAGVNGYNSSRSNRKCTKASSPNWQRSLCTKTGGTVNERSGKYGGCCY